ncbi:MAG: cobalamin biosynthesis protein [Planctomycetaceae bacterium]|nr:cobalamin biosynthesis protein [Planctomycetaceae bacterium]
MRIAIASFSDRGFALGERLSQALAAEGHDIESTRCGAGGPKVGEWTAGTFSRVDALLFVGSVGIAVRAIAPLLAGKSVDPAVVAVDDGGRHAVAVLSGHIGGANDLTATVARCIGAVPVITTATDVAGVFAVDTWAVANGLAIANPDAIKTVSAKALAGETVLLTSIYPVVGSLPDGWVFDAENPDVAIDVALPVSACLWLIPKTYVLGIGCRKGTSEAALAGVVARFCGIARVDMRAIAAVSSIDLKRDEPGLVAFCRQQGVPFTTYSAEALAAVEGTFAASGFVREVAGVDNVCERSAVLGSGGRLRVGKTILGGVALALAEKPYTVDFSVAGKREVDE